MEFDAIVYTSQFGHTKRYAEMLGQITLKPVLPLNSALTSLPCSSRIVYMGWLHASSIRGYKQAAKHFSISLVCGVGLCDTGALQEEVRKATYVPGDVPLFTLQGGMDRSRLKGMDKLLMPKVWVFMGGSFLPAAASPARPDRAFWAVSRPAGTFITLSGRKVNDFFAKKEAALPYTCA